MDAIEGVEADFNFSTTNHETVVGEELSNNNDIMLVVTENPTQADAPKTKSGCTTKCPARYLNM